MVRCQRYCGRRNFLTSTIGFPCFCCMVHSPDIICRVFQETRSRCTTALSPPGNIMQTSLFELLAMCEENADITLPSLPTIPSTMMWTESLFFINISISCEDSLKELLFCKFIIWFWQKFFLSEKECSDFGNAWVYQKLCGEVFHLFFIICVQNLPFSSWWRKSEWLKCIIAWKKSDIPISLAMDLFHMMGS